MSSDAAKVDGDLTIENVTVRFGGITAVDDASLVARGGTITGLLGPNGAGKTTLFNACSGLNRPAAGTVTLGEQVLTGHGSSNRAHRGLGRTFQRMELFESMNVRDNVRTGPAAMFSSRRVLGQLFSTPKETREINERADDALDRCAIAHLADSTVGDLSTGQRRLVELARAIATPFTFLLLDEPSSGLDVQETEDFCEVLLEHVRQTGIGVLVVEHDMALVAQVCERIYVLDFGKMIYSGSTADALQSELVRAAYLGDESVA
jgi:ABC-type branched-subunit amino acid transport system ATPase component